MARALRTMTAVAALLALAGCRDAATGPVAVSAIGGPPQMLNPNLRPLDPPSAFLLDATAQGLVRFNAAGEIEPALAQSWIVSDDGLRHTFRIRRTTWSSGERVTAAQVVQRLSATLSRASRNRLKPVLGAIEDIEAMTDEVLEIRLRGPRPNFLQLLAQPEMAILFRSEGTGPYRIIPANLPPLRLSLPAGDEEDGEPTIPDILLRGESAALAVARFGEDEADLVTGGTAGDLPIARAARLPANRLVLDTVQGLFGFAFVSIDGPLADPAIRQALSMAIDREAIAAALQLPRLDLRASLVPGGIAEMPQSTSPDWVSAPLPMRRERAAAAIAALGLTERLRLRVAMPNAPGYRLAFARLRRDWAAIGVEAERVAPGAEAELRLVDEVAPASSAVWYLRHFTCEAGPVCDPVADEALQAARLAPTAAERRAALLRADAALTTLSPFVPIGAPVRWSLVTPRLTGFRPNQFARHPASELIAGEF